MSVWSDLRCLTPAQRNAVIASFLGWTLDAFDFFILVFVRIRGAEFARHRQRHHRHTLTPARHTRGAVSSMWRTFGATTLMIDILLYSALEFASGFAPTLTTLIVLRALYGVAMGGEWGVGASLTMEAIPPKTRGLVSGLLQAGYPAGYLLASVVFALLFPLVGVGFS